LGEISQLGKKEKEGAKREQFRDFLGKNWAQITTLRGEKLNKISRFKEEVLTNCQIIG
jgi:hypothetical protein